MKGQGVLKTCKLSKGIQLFVINHNKVLNLLDTIIEKVRHVQGTYILRMGVGTRAKTSLKDPQKSKNI